jgi:hypothetical protein
MNQALYAHMNNKRKMKKKKRTVRKQIDAWKLRNLLLILPQLLSLILQSTNIWAALRIPLPHLLSIQHFGKV